MEFTIEEYGKEKRLRLSGSFTFTDHQTFKQMMETVEKSPQKSIILDFSAVDFIDSGALGMLLLFREECQSKHISLSLSAAHGQVEKIFKIAKFDQLFSMRGEE